MNLICKLMSLGTINKKFVSSVIYRCLTISPCMKSTNTTLLKQLKQKILFKGPITVSEYMKEVLTNAVSGYYMHNDVFGVQGDFITSPEISQMFGELIGIWCVNEWMQIGSPDKLQVVELGPGRGTLADDMLRVLAQFPGIRDAVSLHLVEISPRLRSMQAKKLAGNETKVVEKDDLMTECCQSCTSRHNNITVHWYRQLVDVPKAPSFYVAHEFFDALPIHKFQKVDGQWHEVLIDVNDNETCLRFVLSPTNTAASTLLLRVAENDTRNHIEICPEAATLITHISNRIANFGGFALIADYGHTGEKTDTFRAFRQHKLFDVLSEPGTADLTADVDFLYLKQFINNEKVISHGPVTQEHFLHNMGITTRLQVLLNKATNEQRKNLITGYDMLINPDKMGTRFKFFALTQHRLINDDMYIPAAFWQ